MGQIQQPKELEEVAELTAKHFSSQSSIVDVTAGEDLSSSLVDWLRYSRESAHIHQTLFKDRTGLVYTNRHLMSQVLLLRIKCC